MRHPVMRTSSAFRILLLTVTCALVPHLADAAAATLFRLFLLDGSTVVSYGEFARLDDSVVFSMPVGNLDEPRLHLVTLPTQAIDWPRTDRYAASARYHQYAAIRGEEEYQQLNRDVANVLNQIALTTDRRRALELADQARKTLVDWPRAHFGYRQQDVREIVMVLDESISELRAAAGLGAFELSLTASADVALEPVLGPPSPKELLDGIFRVVRLTERAPERVALLQAALSLLKEAGSVIPRVDALAVRRSAERQIRYEASVDASYRNLSRRLMASARRAAANARVAEVESVLNQVARHDARLGHRRPEVVQALQTSLRLQLDAAHRLRLLRDQWAIRRSLYREYQRTTRSWLLQLAKMQPALEAIRRLDGPAPAALIDLQKRLDGGAERLQRLRIPEACRSTHDLVVGAWRFADSAVRTRYDAVSRANVATAWQASSAAAGALLMLSRAQQEMRALLEPPRLQ